MIPSITTRNTVGRRCGNVTARKRSQRFAPSTSAASSTSTGTSCRAARNKSRNVPVVVHTTRTMITDSATLGPANHSQAVSPRMDVLVRLSGGEEAFQSPTASPSRCSSPRGSANQVGPSMPKNPSMVFTAPVPVNRNRKMRLIATELVTEGK